jgi:hypothetical protein
VERLGNYNNRGGGGRTIGGNTSLSQLVLGQMETFLGGPH